MLRDALDHALRVPKRSTDFGDRPGVLNLYNTAPGMSAAERQECLKLLGSRVEIRASGDVRFIGTLPLL